MTSRYEVTGVEVLPWPHVPAASLSRYLRQGSQSASARTPLCAQDLEPEVSVADSGGVGVGHGSAAHVARRVADGQRTGGQPPGETRRVPALQLVQGLLAPAHDG